MIKKILTLPALAFAITAMGQDTTVHQLDEVVVTASKFPQKENATGKVISVITKEEIEKNSGRTLGQLLNQQAGLTINGAANNLGTNQSVYMRGAASGRTLILVDGIPVYDPSLINNEFDLNLLSLNNVERIEICRGAQSTLYGSDAIAGVINIITEKKDVTKPINAKATVSEGTYGTFRGNAQVYGKAGRFSYTARYAKLLTNGFSAAYDSTHSTRFENDGYNGDVAAASVRFQATPELSLKAFAQYSGYKTDLDAGAFTDETDYTLSNKNNMAGAGFQFIKNGVKLTGNYQYSDVKRNYVNDSLDVPGFALYSADDYLGITQFVELYASIELGKGFTLLQGGDFRYSSMNNQYLSISAYGPYTSEFNDTSHSQASLYASLFYQTPDQKLNVELGGRMNVHSRYGDNYTYTFNPSYSINDKWRVFGSIATGFKAPTLYQLYSSYGRRDLKPERSTNYEIAVQQQGVHFTNRLVFFHRLIKDGLDFDNVNYQYFNYNEQTMNGIELESTIQPVKGLNITLNYTYLDPKEESQSRINFKDTTYDYVLRRPKHQVNLQAGYQFQNGLYVSAGGRYVSKRYDTGGYQVADLPLDSYVVLNLYSEYKFKAPVKLFVDIQNLTGKRFFDVRGYNSIPFMLNGGITFNW